VFEFSNVDVAAAASPGALDIYPVGYDGPTPLTILSQTSFRLRNGVVLRLDGAPGVTPVGTPSNGYSAPGGRPGPGGFPGGNGGIQGSPSTNGNPGAGPTGGAGGVANAPGSVAAGTGFNATLTPVATSLVPLIGGSGGGGGGAYDTLCGFRGAGAGGGGGAGALLVAASVQINLEGHFTTTGIVARGGAGGASTLCAPGGAGSSGNVRLVAPTITGISVVAVGTGTVRFEGNTSTFSGLIEAGRGTFLGAPQPVLPTNLPSLRITSVGGIAVGANPTGSASTPDVTFPSAPSGAVSVLLAAANIPIGTQVNLRANPSIGSATTATSSALTGSDASATTASASLSIPAGAGVITATTSFPVSVTMLEQLPKIPGLTPVRVEVTADASGSSRVFLVAADGQRAEVTEAADGRLAVVH
jgi:hypothetical protein